jgi:hypothetical protein
MLCPWLKELNLHTAAEVSRRTSVSVTYSCPNPLFVRYEETNAFYCVNSRF